jgi:type II secretory pathway pseudopilin PulG
MESNTLLWIIVAVVVIAVIAAVVITRGRKRRAETQRTEAAQLRDTSADHHLKLQEHEASAAQAEAEARRVRAEADQRAAEAKRLEVEAQRRDQDRGSAREEHEATLRRADALDPDVRTDKEGYRLDDDGNRIDEGPTPPRPASSGQEDSATGGATAAEPPDRDRGPSGGSSAGGLTGHRDADGDGRPG